MKSVPLCVLRLPCALGMPVQGDEGPFHAPHTQPLDAGTDKVEAGMVQGELQSRNRMMSGQTGGRRGGGILAAEMHTNVLPPFKAWHTPSGTLGIYQVDNWCRSKETHWKPGSQWGGKYGRMEIFSFFTVFFPLKSSGWAIPLAVPCHFSPFVSFWFAPDWRTTYLLWHNCHHDCKSSFPLRFLHYRLWFWAHCYHLLLSKKTQRLRLQS